VKLRARSDPFNDHRSSGLVVSPLWVRKWSASSSVASESSFYERTKTMRHGDAFAGIGGFGLAARRRSWRTVWACEIEPSARAVYSARLGHPGLQFDTNISRVPNIIPDIDILTGGFPCQDLSVAGRRTGLAGERSGLFHHLVRLLHSAGPEWFVFENVPGLLSSERGRDMQSVIHGCTGYAPRIPPNGWGTAGGAIGPAGYAVFWRVLNAQFFGVAQRRRRVFFVGCRGDWRRAAAVLFEPQGVYGHPPAFSEARRAVAGTLERSSGDWSRSEPGQNIVAPLTQRPYGDDATDDPPLVAGTLTKPNGGWRLDVEMARDNLIVAPHTLRGTEGFDATEDGTGRGVPLLAYQCHGSNVGPAGVLRSGNGNATGGVPFMAVAENQRGEIRLSENFGAINTPGGKPGQGYPLLAFNPQAGGSVVGGTKDITDALGCHQTPGVIGPPPDPTRVRTSSGLPGPLDVCEVDQDGPDSPRYRGLGNAVAIPPVEWICERIDGVRSGRLG
jgi:DNA (cytosine-5)-methyltransferase 1